MRVLVGHFLRPLSASFLASSAEVQGWTQVMDVFALEAQVRARARDSHTLRMEGEFQAESVLGFDSFLELCIVQDFRESLVEL
jgi:hypothetical protein